jgi:hypothetical protein
MDDIALLRALPPETGSPDAARADALVALEASFHGAAGGSAAGPARARRRGLFALAGTGAAAAVVAGALVVSTGPSAEPAAAAVLRQTAGVAASASDQAGVVPGPGQFLYTRTKSRELQVWTPGGITASYGVTFPGGKETFTAFNTWEEEEWRSDDGTERSRWVEGTPQFLSSAEQSRWEKAGSPNPHDASRSGFPGFHINELRPGVSDVEGKSNVGFRNFSAFPTEAKALRLAIEEERFPGLSGGPDPAGGSSTTGQVIAELWFILDQPDVSPALRAAVFGALAELPGIELNRDATDMIGRSGSALSYESTGSTSYGEEGPGRRIEYIFDPKTSAVLGRREVITDPSRFPWEKGIAAGTVLREVAYLGSGIVGSTHEKPDERGGEPIATGPVYRSR